MVDAIGPAGKPITSIEEIKLNWHKMTASQVLKHEKEGQEAPKEILKWAQDMAVMSGAVDDVTYEMSQDTENPLDEINLEEGNGEQAPLTGAQQKRADMNTGGESILNQTKIMTAESKTAENDVRARITEMETAANTASVIGSESDGIASTAESETNKSKAEYDELAAKLQKEEPLTKQEKTRLVILGQELNKIGGQAQNQLGDMSGQIQELDSVVNGSMNTSANALDYGSETVSVSQELLGIKEDQRKGTKEELTSGVTDKNLQSEISKQAIKTAFKKSGIFAFFTSKVVTGLKGIAQGLSAVNTGNEGQSKITSTEGTISSANSTVDSSKARIKNATLVEAKSDNTAPQESDKTKETDETAKEKEENEFTLANEDIITDPNKILERKERKGIQT